MASSSSSNDELQFIDVVVQDFQSKRLCEFTVQKNATLTKLRQYINKECGHKEFRFICGKRAQARTTEHNKFIKTLDGKLIQIKRIRQSKQVEKEEFQKGQGQNFRKYTIYPGQTQSIYKRPPEDNLGKFQQQEKIEQEKPQTIYFEQSP